MKTLLASISILAATVGMASAEIAISGNARMGIIDDFGDGDPLFTSRVRVIFTASGETDSGISFGATVRNDQSGQGNTLNGDSTVYVSGGFGKLSMGDVDGAANAAVGQVDGVGFTGLSDVNEISFIANGGTDFDAPGATGPDDTFDTSALYEYSVGGLSFYLSATQWDQPTGGQAVSVATRYTAGAYTIALGYENLNASDSYIWEQYVLGGSATFGAVTVKAIFADGRNNQGFDWKQYSVSATYSVDGLAVTAFVGDDEDLADDDLNTSGSVRGYGLGASYDLGGGASVAGGYVRNRTDDTSAFDLGLNFAF